MAKKQVKKQVEQKPDYNTGLPEASEPRVKSGRKRKSVIEFQQTDGKIYNKYGVKSIDELLGESKSRYKTHDIAAYEKMVSEMNTSDLQNHATTVDVMPNQDRNVLIKRLLKQFKVTNSNYFNTSQTQDPLKKQINKNTLDILAEGR